MTTQPYTSLGESVQAKEGDMMQLGEIISSISEATESMLEFSAGLLSIAVDSVHHLTERMNSAELFAVATVIAVISLLLVSKLLRLVYAVLKYLAIPAVALAVLGSVMLAVPFLSLLPFTATGCALVLLYKA